MDEVGEVGGSVDRNGGTTEWKWLWIVVYVVDEEGAAVLVEGVEG